METFGIKVTEELKKKAQDIIKDNFDSGNDFLEQIVSIWELNQLKQGANILSADVEELESLTRRINGIFINANAKINTMLQDKDIYAEQQTELKQRLIERLQGDIGKLEQEKEQFSNINDNLVNLNEEYKQEVNKLTKSNQTLNDLVVEYKEKNDTLTGLLKEYKEDREQNKELQQKNKELLDKLYQMQVDADRQGRELKAAEEKAQEQTHKHQSDIGDLLRKHSEELDATKRKAEIDTNMMILELQQEHQKKLQDMQDKNNREIEQYQAKYKELLEQMETKKISSKSEPKQQVKAPVNK